MRSLWLLGSFGLVALAGCYRGDGAAPPATPGEVLVQNGNEEPACGRSDDLTLPPIDVNPSGRLRTHVSGPLSGASRRSWAGPAVPDYIPMRLDTLELFLADDADRGILALYREPYQLGSCTLGGATNCAYEARYYTDDGRLAWSLRLDRVLSRPDHLEIQDIRLVGGVLYFNEACQSYSRDAGGECSSLVAVDPIAARVLWRTPPRVSNGRFRVRGCYIVTGYGFTSEPDHVFLIERATGEVVQFIPVSTAPQELTLVGRDRLDVTLYAGATRRFELHGFETAAGRLVPLDPPEAMFGGWSYGGATYGGATYGGATYGRPRAR